MAGITDNSTGSEVSAWKVTCHYDSYSEGKEPAGFMECVALFVLESQQGWDDSFRPSCFPGKEAGSNGGLL